MPDHEIAMIAQDTADSPSIVVHVVDSWFHGRVIQCLATYRTHTPLAQLILYQLFWCDAVAQLQTRLFLDTFSPQWIYHSAASCRL